LSASINRVVIVGNLTRDPETRQAGEYSITALGVAVNERVKQNGEYVERANYLDVDVWGKMGENCAKYLGKGRQVAIDGRLRWESWEKDGQKRSKVKIVADNVQFLGAKADAEAKPFAEAAAAAGFKSDDDIPF
jgi:single-strand DNA-binding protein